MTSCTIIISHFNSLNFLRAAVRQMRKYEHTEIKQTILICDQSDYETWSQIEKEYGNSTDMILVHTDSLYSGFGIDYCMRHIDIKTDYIAQYHCDCFPIHINHLYLPIQLIEEYNYSFVGQLQCINGKDNLASIYPPSPFFAMAQCFNVAKTETYKELSLKAGFTRFHNRQTDMAFENNDWVEWAAGDYNARGSDDDIVAFSWQDRHRQDDKLGLAISGYIQPSFGRIIDGLVFHFGSANEARANMSTMPELYQHYTKRINEDYSDELISEMLELAQKNKPPELEILSRNHWNGTTKESSSTTEELNNRIEELKIIK